MNSTCGFGAVGVAALAAQVAKSATIAIGENAQPRNFIVGRAVWSLVVRLYTLQYGKMMSAVLWPVLQCIFLPAVWSASLAPLETSVLDLTNSPVIGETNQKYASYTIDASYNRGKSLHW